jgi:hypothetical protein
MLDLNKSKIVSVFPDQKAAAEDRHFKGGAAICKAIKLGTQSGGHYFQMWFSCNEDLKDTFLADNELPCLRTPSLGRCVQQINPISNVQVKLHRSIQSVLRDQRMGRLSLLKAMEDDSVLKNFKWRLVDETTEDI